jgi:hypothetical protein
MVEACANAKLKERYIFVPTDDDFPLLLDDIHRHGLRPIIGVLLVLSTLHYPPTDDIRKYELGTLIRAFLALVTFISSRGEPQNEETPFSVETLLADEHLLLLSEEETDESAP